MMACVFNSVAHDIYCSTYYTALTALLELRCWMSCLTDTASASAALELVPPCCARAAGLASSGVGEEPLPLPRAEAGVPTLGSMLEASLPAGVATVLASRCVSWVGPMPLVRDMCPACEVGSLQCAELQQAKEGEQGMYLEQHHPTFHSGPAWHAHGWDFPSESLQGKRSH